ncbi:hypothetical protein BHE74_00032505, partial [Ensete ventricosum]
WKWVWVKTWSSSKSRRLFVWFLQTHILKVNIHCDGCKLKVKKLLHRTEGTYSRIFSCLNFPLQNIFSSCSVF